jgi:hypothetical protein
MTRLDLDAIEARYRHGQIASDPTVIHASMHDVPGLVAEIKRLRAEVEEWKTTAMAGAEVLADRDAELRVARATVVRLDTELLARLTHELSSHETWKITHYKEPEQS